jgi:hypothetical protein
MSFEVSLPNYPDKMLPPFELADKVDLQNHRRIRLWKSG